MTYAPQPLLDLRHYLQPLTGLADYELGIVGDTAHNGGYHHGWDNRSGSSDYSWTESSRDSSHKTNAAAAMDIGMFARLRELSIWLAGECAAGASDTADIREVIYSPDGKTVHRWDRLGVRSSGDSSHLTHTHVSWFRDAEDRSKTAVFQRFFEGADEMGLSTSYKGPDGHSRTVEQMIVDTFDEMFFQHWSRQGFDDSYGAQLTGIDSKVDGLTVSAPAPVDPEAIKAVLLDPEVLAAIARAVNDEDHKRSAG